MTTRSMRPALPMLLAVTMLLGAVRARAEAPLPAHDKTGHGPAVLLIHCMGGDRHEWRDVAAQLRTTHTVIAVDLPGMGATPARAKYDADEVADELAALLTAEHASPAIVIGHSLGGAIAAHVAERHPDQVAGLVVVDMLINESFDQAEVDRIRAALAKDRAAELGQWFGSIMKPGDMERLRPTLDRTTNATLVGWADALRRAPLRDGGAKLTMPTLLMATAMLLPDKRPRAEELAAIGFGRAPRLTVERFADAKHWIMWNEPRRFQDVLAAWLAKLPAAAATTR